MSQLDQIIMFLEVVENKSFTAAGEKLLISANAVNKQVTQLEENLGVTLLQRSTRHLSLTEVGKNIYQKGKILQENWLEIQQYAQSLQKNPQGALTVVSTVGVGQHLLTPHLTEFLKKYPEIKLNLKFSDEFPAFSSVDLAFGFPASLVPKDAIENDLIRRKIYTIERIVCASPSYLSKYGEPKNYEDLHTHCYIVHSQNQNNPLLKQCELKNIQFLKTLTVNNTLAILNMMIQGDGMASSPDFVVKDSLNKGSLKRILNFHKENKVAVYIFYKKNRFLSKNIACFVDFFLSAWNRPSNPHNTNGSCS
ncbi:MAG: LysR family transcriptional regulator [Proteobacteria bacterium]|nr:LysR family transcriptional regulator [Pseudomonadota bacterium]